MKLEMLVLAFALVGCGGGSFTGGAGGEADALDPVETDGGSVVVSTGGRSGNDSDAGAPASGGVASSGGASTSTGGAPPSTGGSPSSGGAAACTPVTHDNGVGQTWQDCVPLGTYTRAQATAACNAYLLFAPSCSYGNRCLPIDCGGGQGAVNFVSQCGGYQVSWLYSGQNAAVGHVGLKTACATSQDPTWD